MILPTFALIFGIVTASSFALGAAATVINLLSCILLIKVVDSCKLQLDQQLAVKFYKLSFSAMFFYLGATIWLSHNGLIEQQVRYLNSCQVLSCKVLDLKYTVQNKFKTQAILTITNAPYFVLGQEIKLLLRKNFLWIGDEITIKNFDLKFDPSKDIKQSTLGSIYNQPYKTKVEIQLRPKEISWLEKIRLFRKRLIYRIQKKLSIVTRSFFGLIFLGQKQQELPVNLRDFFQKWGISHYLARSGLHLSIFIYLCFWIFCFINLGYRLKLTITLVVSAIYAVLTFLSTSFLRAAIMFGLTIAGRLFYKNINQLHFLTIACLSILVSNPYQLFALDFQLSFALVFALLTTSGYINKKQITPRGY